MQAATDDASDAAAGAAIYTPRTLRLYDVAVYRVFSPLLWRCPASVLQEHYDRHASANHLDVGVGTGRLLDRCRFGSPRPRLVLADLNPHCLAAAARRLARHAPRTVLCDVLQPLAHVPGAPFDSVGAGYLLHCLPGPMRRKAVALDHLAALLAPGGVLFGATILAHGAGVRHTPASRWLLRRFNRRGVFGNLDDGLDDLAQALEARFAAPRIEVRGTVALFAARARG